MPRRKGKEGDRSLPRRALGEVGVAVEQLVDEPVLEKGCLGDQEAGIGVAKDVVPLVGRRECADRHDDRADAAGGERGDDELRPVPQHERHRRALRDSGREKRPGELAHFALEFDVGEAAVAEHQRLAVAVAFGDVGDEPAEGHSLLIGVESEVPAHDVTTGSASQPRIVDDDAIRAFTRSTSQSGKRFRTSSMAMRPSTRARAAPRQKWMLWPKVMC